MARRSVAHSGYGAAPTRARALRVAGGIAYRLGDFQRAAAHADESLLLFRRPVTMQARSRQSVFWPLLQPLWASTPGRSRFKRDASTTRPDSAIG